MHWAQTINVGAPDRMTETAASPQSAGHTAELEMALEQKTALLHEVDHRVKNNLQLIASLLLLQTRRTSDPGAREALRGMLERVNAVATVHRRLFQNEDVQRFDVAEFVRDLVGDMIGASGREDIRVHLDLRPVSIPASRAAPLALVISEAVSNCMRHAFADGRSGDIWITLGHQGGEAWIEIRDNGVGRLSGSADGFGSTVIQLLCRQLKAQCAIEDANPGVKVLVTLPTNGEG
jgi:two-component sensor histidine kinase